MLHLYNDDDDERYIILMMEICQIIIPYCRTENSTVVHTICAVIFPVQCHAHYNVEVDFDPAVCRDATHHVLLSPPICRCTSQVRVKENLCSGCCLSFQAINGCRSPNFHLLRACNCDSTQPVLIMVIIIRMQEL